MNSVRYLSHGARETTGLGKRLSRFLQKGDIVCLFGDLGTGKTTLAKGIAQGLKINSAFVNSPTFTLLNAYEGRLPLFHFDFYRIENEQDIFSIGYEEFLYDNGVSVIEWAERLGALLPKEYVSVRFTIRGEQKRLIQISGRGTRAKEILKHLK